MGKKIQIELDFDIEHFRYSLVGDGYTLDEVEKLTSETLIDILRKRINDHIETEYYRGKRLGLYD